MKTKNGRFILSLKCAVCGSNLGIKAPLSKIPLLNVLF